ncbi:phosphoesterase [Flavobacterium phage vB_FspM_immuto_2-6A]|uniref:Phosphoesterase n=1 Tax=Flavobacterium phage vB_FspM_immuto_2-6A TaxID=2801477 RepID=A0A7T8ERF1_9CAUD|nr:metallo-phosphoesterase [Flavobacterium phage vB_FspM_immuto_2-6A]QQO91718.1 phosphoesterase [Flavobacterium phage vB_FspM_immuto_2-6A]
MKITFISDTHTRQGQIPYTDLPGGDLLIHAGDIMNSGYNKNDIFDFLHWYDSIPGYDKKVFIAGNHDRMFENDPEEVKEILKQYPNIIYLQDESYEIYDLETDRSIKLYGSPWQPEFYSWAFNLQRNSLQLSGKWEAIPDDTDILITHGPAWGSVDTVAGRPWDNLGCELLAERIQRFRPKIHVCGHIHSGYGIETIDNIHYINASVLDERYEYTQKPWNVEWDQETNEIVII